jgi:hypothetical protein
MYLRKWRAGSVLGYMREDIIKMELEDMSCATVVWAEINLKNIIL